MSNWYNLLMSLLLFSLCVLCVLEIGNNYSFVGGGRSSIETRIEHGFSFYNQSVFTLLTSISIACLSWFFLMRFIRADISFLTWNHRLGILPFALTFFVVLIDNSRMLSFKFHFNYFLATGLSTAIVLFYFNLFSEKLVQESLDDVLDHP